MKAKEKGKKKKNRKNIKILRGEVVPVALGVTSKTISGSYWRQNHGFAIEPQRLVG